VAMCGSMSRASNASSSVCCFQNCATAAVESSRSRSRVAAP
jgi:hypothetical protein